MTLHQRYLSTLAYDVLSQTNPTFLVDGNTLDCTNIPLFAIDGLYFLFHVRNYSPLLLQCLPLPT